MLTDLRGTLPLTAADPTEVKAEYGIMRTSWKTPKVANAIVLAVARQEILSLPAHDFLRLHAQQ